MLTNLENAAVLQLAGTTTGMKTNTKLDIEDILLWPDGTWCYRYELKEMTHKSDDYGVLYFDSEEYNEFLEKYDF